MNLRTPAWVPPGLIECIVDAGELQDRLIAARPRPPLNLRGPSRRHPNPQKRRRNPGRDYGLTRAEVPEWRWLMAHKRYTALEAANVVLRSRKGSQK